MKKLHAFLPPIFAVVLLSLSGCMQAKALPHIDELLTLKGYSQEKDDQAQWVEERAQSFKQLTAAVADGSIKNFADQTSFINAFGQPVLRDSIDEQKTIRWLYRHPIQSQAAQRVYVYWSPDGRFLKSELITAH